MFLREPLGLLLVGKRKTAPWKKSFLYFCVIVTGTYELNTTWI
jgi:hypothetical protein